MIDFGYCLQTAIRRAGISQKALAEKSGFTPMHINNLCKNKKAPTLEAIDKVCSALCISPSELFAPGANVQRADDSYHVFSQLNRAQFSAIRTVAELLLRNSDDQVDSDLASVVPNGLAAAGIPLTDSNVDEQVNVPAKYLDGRFFIVKAKGNSMAPKIKNGDCVVVQKNLVPEAGEIALVCISSNGENEYTIKIPSRKDTTVTLKSINHAYPPQIYSSEDVLSIEKVVKIIHVEQ